MFHTHPPACTPCTTRVLHVSHASTSHTSMCLYPIRLDILATAPPGSRGGGGIFLLSFQFIFNLISLHISCNFISHFSFIKVSICVKPESRCRGTNLVCLHQKGMLYPLIYSHPRLGILYLGMFITSSYLLHLGMFIITK